MIRPDRITSFDIAVCESQRHRNKFAVVSPGSISDAENVQRKIDIFLNFYLAIVPNVSTILFEINTLVDVGSPLYRHNDGSTVYHLPKRVYAFIEEIVEESEFLLSHSLLKKIVDTDKVYDSLFKLIDQEWRDPGVLVVGVYSGETQEA